MATPAQLSEVEAWLAQFTAAIRDMDAGTAAAVAFAYSTVEDWQAPTQTLAAAAAASAASQAGRQGVAEAAAQFVSTVVAVLRGQRPRPTTPNPLATYPRPVEAFDVYSRPIFAYRDAIAAGLAEREAQIAAFQRAEMLALTDNLLARRDAAVAELVRNDVTHYRRVIRPELSRTGTCGLCITAASRVYTRDDLMPIHTRCKCEVIPIVGEDDLGERFNLSDLRDIYAGIGTTKRNELARYRYTVEDGELGPTLLPSSPADGRVAAGGVTNLGFERQSPEWVRQQIDLTEGLPDSEWRTQQLARLRARLPIAA